MKLIVRWERVMEVPERDYVTLRDAIYSAAWDACELINHVESECNKFTVETPAGMRWEIDFDEPYHEPRRIV